MLLKRLIGAIPIHEGIAIQSIGFSGGRPLGAPEIAASNFAAWGIDEIMLFDIDASVRGSLIDPDQVSRVSSNTFVPLVAGGGITGLNHITMLLNAGDDKVLINSSAVGNCTLVRSAVEHFGAQCIVAGLDVKQMPNGSYEVVTKSGSYNTEMDPIKLALEYESWGVGELFINCVDRDGLGQGYDLGLARAIVNAVLNPVIFAGGAGHPEHILELLTTVDVSPAIGNMLHFSEHSVAVIKAYLIKHGLPFRYVPDLDYACFEFCNQGRINALFDVSLSELVFDNLAEKLI